MSGAEGFAALADGVKARFASVVGFVHAAGFDAVAPLGMIADDALARLVAVHADFPLKFLGWLGRRGNHAEGASCVLVSSLAAHEGAKGHAAYAAAKGAVEGLLKPAAAELAAKPVNRPGLSLEWALRLFGDTGGQNTPSHQDRAQSR